MPPPTWPRLLGAAVGTWALALAVNRSLRDVEGGSMEPTLSAGDRIAIVPTAVAPVRRGDVVVVRDPREPERATVKRVVAMPGELVEVRDGRLVVDGVSYLEGYATTRIGEAVAVLGDDEYFVLGDNRAASTDSRAYGPVPADLIEGVVVATVRPQLKVGLRTEPWPLAPAHRAG